jgi:peptide methionine sulfoxide reductase msrA/msrB
MKANKIWSLVLIFLLVFAAGFILKAIASPKNPLPSADAGNKPSMEQTESELDLTGKSEIYLAGGCFWGTQKFFDQFDGVVFTEVGYANGPEEKTDYEEVSRGSGHAETVRVVYDPAKISLAKLLDYYFLVIDPVSVNQQGNDIGVQYRTGIYYKDPALLPDIQTVYNSQEETAGERFAVEVEPLKNFWPAEDYHQKYLEKNPGGYCHIPHDFFDLQNNQDKAMFDK